MSISSLIRSGAFLLSFGTLLSYLLGAIRDIIFAQYFGTSILTDLYFSVFLVSDILLMIFISSALQSVLTPLYLSAHEESIEKGKIRIGNFFTLLQGIFTIVMGIFFIGAPFFGSIFFPEFYTQYPHETVILLRILLGVNLLFGISNFFGNILMAQKFFLSTALSPLLYNLGIIIGIITLHEQYGILSPAFGAVIGVILHGGLRILEMHKHHLWFSLCITPIDPAFGELIKGMITRGIGMICIPLLFLLFSYFSRDDQGLYTTFLYVRNLESAPVAMFGIAIATAAFQHFSSLFSQNKDVEALSSFYTQLGKIWFWTLPSSVGFFFIGPDLLALIYQFDPLSPAYEWMKIIIQGIGISIVFESSLTLLSRYFHSRKQPFFSLLTSIILFISTIFSLIILSQFFSLPFSLGISYSIGFLIAFSFGLYFLPVSKKGLSIFWKPFKKSALASIFLILFFILLSIPTISTSLFLISGIIGASIIFIGITRRFVLENIK